jgi:hypothetical protein
MADKWVPLVPTFEKHKIKSHTDVKKHWPEGLTRNNLQLGQDGNAMVRVTPELAQAEAAAAAAQAGGNVPATQAHIPEQVYNQAALAAMQQNPMAYLALTQQQAGQGFQIKKPAMQFDAMEITGRKPKQTAATKSTPKAATREPQVKVTVGTPQITSESRTIPGLTIPVGQQPNVEIGQVSVAPSKKTQNKLDKSDLIKIAQHALKMHGKMTMSEDDSE